ncbi:MAG: tRNA (adenosine(37)-N6)-threonylcarbamoyltransferase complex dimerization subunit type 1 TsaB [Planctomycetota bacterium]
MHATGDRPVITLAIETSNPGSGPDAAGVGVYDLSPKTTVERARLTLAPRSRHDDALVPAIDACVREAGLTPSELGRVAVSVGPGGYTSIRIAVTAAKMICEATGASCVPVPTAHALAHTHAREGDALVCLAWKRGDVWRQTFRDAQPIDAGRVIAIDQLDVPRGTLLITDEALRERLTHIESLHETPRFDPRAIAECSAQIEPVDPLELLPLYSREPEAVRLWEQRR